VSEDDRRKGRGKRSFTQSDLTAVLKSARDAGVKLRGRITAQGIEFEMMPQGDAEADQEMRTSEWAGAKPF
jgi:hypothetical protein